MGTINRVTGNGGYKLGRKCLDHRDQSQTSMIIREKNTEKEIERMIAVNCLCLLNEFVIFL